MASEPAECAPDEVRFTLQWERTTDGGLTGQLIAENVSPHPRVISGKPAIRPIGVDGVPLTVQMMITLELRIPPYALLAPGGRAAAPVRWAGWDGPPASDQVLVEWRGGSRLVTATGPTQPDPPVPGIATPTNITSSWFTTLR